MMFSLGVPPDAANHHMYHNCAATSKQQTGTQVASPRPVTQDQPSSQGQIIFHWMTSQEADLWHKGGTATVRHQHAAIALRVRLRADLAQLPLYTSTAADVGNTTKDQAESAGCSTPSILAS
ncbi:hypothetical protein OEZ85_007478 [Tetradesmus obliquus]|uniref:Uncharacterized protein n=1 Tax=Tetradesmus obliquus TaxID=3088 RepID=A0ABY8TG34_TETOB|nr:hypothetical protein OEZ85_007478 [Tetradesmus obliquus]